MSRIRIANAPCSWGVLEFDRDKKAPFERVLDEMKQAGYEGTELGDWGFMPTDPAELGDELRRRDLVLLGAFVPVALRQQGAHAPGVDLAVRTATLLAALNDQAFLVLADDNGTVPDRTRNAGRIGPELELTDAEWKIFAHGANRVAAAVRDATGLRTVFHHHCAGYVETPGEIDRLLSLTDPKLLGLCLDTGHGAFGGGDPLRLLEQHPERVWHVHFKDCSTEVAATSRARGWDYFESVRHGVFCELGQGVVPFREIAGLLEKRGYAGSIVVEQDVLAGMGTPLESAKRNRAFLREIGL